MKQINNYNDKENEINNEQRIFSVLENNKDEKSIINEIKLLENKNIDLSKLIEEKTKNSILVSASFYNLTEVSIYLIDYFRNKLNTTTKFLDYLNLRNIKGYDALLYSAYRGNYDIFKKLLDNGAHLNSNNINGLNVLHLSTQGNRLNIITALMEKYIFDINKQDNQGNTALHWAIYFNNQQCIDYLLHYNINIDIADINNCTAMDLAIKRENEQLIEKIKNSFIIKYGISTKIKKYFSTKEMIQIFLRMYLYILFLIILILSEMYNQMLISIFIKQPKINTIFIILFIIQLFFYYSLNRSDSNKKENNNKESLLSLLHKDYDMNNVCPWCIQKMNEKSCHCAYCKKCVEFQEFHNSLLNICIGKNNFKLYLIYLSILTIIFILKSFLVIYCFKISSFSLIKENKYIYFINAIITFAICYICIFRLFRKIKLYKSSKSEKEVWDLKGERNHFFPDVDNRIIIN